MASQKTRRVFRRLATVSALVLALGGLAACSGTVSAADAAHHASISTNAVKPTRSPTPTPTPTPSIVPTDHTGEQAAQTLLELQAQGLVVVFVDASGVTVPDATGWSVASTDPAPGTPLFSGATVRVTVTPPPPPPPPAPAPAPAPAGNGATALCNDGTVSYSATHQGTCSHHGGVSVWYR
jgi:hypothetical protein